jgi:hypothetical protein
MLRRMQTNNSHRRRCYSEDALLTRLHELERLTFAQDRQAGSLRIHLTTREPARRSSCVDDCLPSLRALIERGDDARVQSWRITARMRRPLNND